MAGPVVHDVWGAPKWPHVPRESSLPRSTLGLTQVDHLESDLRLLLEGPRAGQRAKRGFRELPQMVTGKKPSFEMDDDWGYPPFQETFISVVLFGVYELDTYI